MWCALVVTLLMQEQEPENKESRATGIADEVVKVEGTSAVSSTENAVPAGSSATVTTSDSTTNTLITTTASAAAIGK